MQLLILKRDFRRAFGEGIEARLVALDRYPVVIEA
jgi:hypothetical protein